MMTEKEIYHVKEDPYFSKPFIDVEEDREWTLWDGRKIPYHYCHGGFEDTAVKFSYCFPMKENYTGRFFHYLSPFPGPDEEMASFDKVEENDKIGFTMLHGAYFVESNMGSAAMFGPKTEPQLVWKSSAAVAEYSRVKAMEYYGCERPYGYVYGGSGGGYKTMACIENTDAWDGAVPFVIGSPASLPNTITMHVQGERALRNVFPQIIDALDAGGSGDMYAGLNEDEAAMLKELTAMGFPPMAWFQEAWGYLDPGSLPVLTPGVKMSDPIYFEDFWTKPGHLGTQEGSSAIKDRLVFEGVVKSVHLPGDDETAEAKEKIEGRNGVDDAWKKMLADGNGYWIELEEVPQGDDLYLEGVNISFLTGEAAGGGQLLLDDIKGNYLTIGACYGLDDLSGVLAKVKPGDKLKLDNSDYIAIQSYYRHQVPPDKSFHVWDQFRDENGEPAIPQRANFMGYGFSGTGTVQDGNIQGKVIVVQALMDESTCPWCGDWYRNKVKETKGSEDDFRLYYMERCMHGDVQEWESHMTTNYLGALRQALLDMSDWVERGIEPIATTNYTYDDGQIYVPDTAKERGGVQPVVEFLANGSACAHVKAGEPVQFTVKAVMPKDAGAITEVAIDFVTNKIFPNPEAFRTSFAFEAMEEDGLSGAVAKEEFTYDAPGTYFAAVRVKGSRTGSGEEIFTQIRNLARVRVVVE